jgi:hypothetical protein
MYGCAAIGGAMYGCAAKGCAGAFVIGATIGALGVGAGTDADGARGIDAGIGSGDGALRNEAPATTAIGAGVRSGPSGAGAAADGGAGTGADGGAGTGADGTNGANAADELGAAGATDGADRGATDGGGGMDGARGAMPPRGTIDPDFARIGAGASDMRVVEGAALGGARSGLLIARLGAFAAGATPAIVFLRFGWTATTGRASGDALSAPLFRPSDPNAAPMRKL